MWRCGHRRLEHPEDLGEHLFGIEHVLQHILSDQQVNDSSANVNRERSSQRTPSTSTPSGVPLRKCDELKPGAVASASDAPRRPGDDSWMARARQFAEHLGQHLQEAPFAGDRETPDAAQIVAWRWTRLYEHRSRRATEFAADHAVPGPSEQSAWRLHTTGQHGACYTKPQPTTVSRRRCSARPVPHNPRSHRSTPAAPTWSPRSRTTGQRSTTARPTACSPSPSCPRVEVTGPP